MKNKKWILSLVAILIFALTLTACGKKEETVKPEDIPAVEGDNNEDVADKPEEPTEEPAGEDNSLQKVLDSGKLVVATSADYPPYEFIALIDGKDEVVGFDISLVKYIAEELGVELVLQNMDFDNVLMAIPSGKADLGVAGLSSDPEREMEFSDVYYDATHSVLVMKDNVDNITSMDEMKGKLIGAQLGTTQEKILEGMDGVEYKTLVDVRNIVMELRAGKIDGVMMETAVADAYVAANEDMALAPNVVVADTTEGTAIGMKKGSIALKEKVNEIIQKIKDEDLMNGWVAEANELAADQGIDN